MDRTASRGLPLLVFVAACFLVSGATALVYEVVWLRQLATVFGSTSLATSTVLATFMGGLALGAHAAGRLVHPGRRLLLAYGLLEAALGLYALATPALFTAVDEVFHALYRAWEPAQPAALALRFVLSGAVLLVPTTCMGATLPILSLFVTARADRVGQSVGLLYALNTIGAVAGTLAGGFLLLPAIGARATLLATGGVNLLLGAAVALVARGSAAARPRPPAAAAESAPATALGLATHPGPAVLAAVAGISGTTALAYEVGWTRLLGMALTTSVYAFTTMLATFLVGLALGGLLFGALADRLGPRGRTVLLAGLQAAAGLAALLTLRWLQELPILYAAWFRRLVPATASLTPEQRNAAVIGLRFGLAALVMFPPTLFLGGTLPVVIRATTAHLVRLGWSVGRVYTVNTVGAIAGSVGAGFLLIPLLGIRGTLVAAAVTNLVLGGALLVLVRPAPWLPRLVALAALAASGALAVGTLPPLDARVLSAAIHWNIQRLARGDRADFAELIAPYTVRFHRDGITASVVVGQRRDDAQNRWMAIDGQVDASSHDDLPTQILLAQIPMALAPRTDDVLVIGLASGMTLGSVLQHPLRHATAVEIEPVVAEACRAFFGHVNHGALEDPRVTLVFDDARAYLRHAPAQYDVIVSEPSHPWRSGSSRLFTREFWERSRRALRPDGVFGQWVHIYALGVRDAQSIVKTFHEVFPYAFVFALVPEQDLLLVGSGEPLRLDAARVAARLAVPAVAADLRRLRPVAAGGLDMTRPANLLASFRAGPAGIARFGDGAPDNTDDNSFVEFSAPLSLLVNRGAEIEQELGRDDDVLAYLELPPGSPAEQAAFLAELARAYQALRLVAPARQVAERARRIDPGVALPDALR